MTSIFLKLKTSEEDFTYKLLKLFKFLRMKTTRKIQKLKKEAQGFEDGTEYKTRRQKISSLRKKAFHQKIHDELNEISDSVLEEIVLLLEND